MSYSRTRIKHVGLAALAGLALTATVFLSPLGSTAVAQPEQDGGKQSEPPTLAEQIAELRASLGRLESQLERDRRSISAAQNTGKSGKGSPGMGGRKGGMGGGNKGGGMGSGMGSKGGMGGGKISGGMGGGSMGGNNKASGTGTATMGTMAGSAAQQSPLPGFPGASHLYHIGATDFFLDHDEHITLGIEQRSALGRIREEAQLQAATFDRRLAELEQELWVLTASDLPDISLIEEKIRKIEQVRGDQRIAFIRAVGNAAQTLTEEQRKVLVGAEPMAAPPKSSDNSQ